MTDVSQPGRILIVEDDPAVSSAMTDMLEVAGHDATAVGTAREMRTYLEERTPELVLLDLGLPDADGLDILSEIQTSDELVSVVVVTGTSDVATVVEAMRLGAQDFLPKPISTSALLDAVDRSLERHRFKRHRLVYQRRVGSPAGAPLPDLIGSCPEVENVRAMAARVAATDSSVLILGESGTGKGLVARGIHRMSDRAAGPFVAVNCASIQTQLLESELFGHEKGAFTGAVDRKTGLLEVADGGTLFLDEVSEMDVQSQGKLLTAVEERAFRRVGGVRQIDVNVRLLAATHRDLQARVAEGLFREDLYYRLNVFQIQLPPLRDRGDDVLQLARFFVSQLNPTIGRAIEHLSDEAGAALLGSSWPGNVRELRNVMERAAILCEGRTIDVDHLPPDVAGAAEAGSLDERSLAELEAEHIARVVRRSGVSKRQAAEILGISRSTLYLKMNQYGIDR
jgi:two-component system response regulator HydG